MLDAYGEASAPPSFASIVAPKICDVHLELDMSHRRTLQTAADAAAGEQTPFFAAFVYKNDPSTKTGSGQS
jgi:hypothetical protein